MPTIVEVLGWRSLEEKLHFFAFLDKKSESCVFLQTILDHKFENDVVDCKTPTIVKLSLPRITTRWESILVIHILFGRHERPPLLFDLLPLFLQALER